jgi:hypothetical protein
VWKGTESVLPAELAVLSCEQRDVTALTPVDTFKVEVATGLHRPEHEASVTYPPDPRLIALLPPPALFSIKRCIFFFTQGTLVQADCVHTRLGMINRVEYVTQWELAVQF